MKLIKIGDEWFAGFTLRGDEKQRVAKSRSFPLLLTHSQVPGAMEDLKNLGVTDAKVYGIYEMIQ